MGTSRSTESVYGYFWQIHRGNYQGYLRVKGEYVLCPAGNQKVMTASLKYECVYLHAWSGGREAKAGIANWIKFYNHKRPDKVHKGLTPDAAYWRNRLQQETDQMTQRVA